MIDAFDRPVPSTATVREGNSGAAARADHDHGPVILTAPNGSQWQLGVSNSGAVSTSLVTSSSAYRDAVLADGPLVYWRLGDSSLATTLDSSGNSRNGAYGSTGGTDVTLGTAGLIAGDSNTAATFHGSVSTDWAQIADAPWMDVTDLTLECWIKHGAMGGGAENLWDRDPAGTRMFQWRLETSGKLRFTDLAGGITSLDSVATFTDNVKHHLVTTFTGGVVRTYVDGVQDATSTGHAALNAVNCPLTLGASYGNTGGLLQPFNGVIDEAAYYGTALSAVRIAAHYAAGA